MLSTKTDGQFINAQNKVNYLGEYIRSIEDRFNSVIRDSGSPWDIKLVRSTGDRIEREYFRFIGEIVNSDNIVPNGIKLLSDKKQFHYDSSTHLRRGNQ